MKKFLLIILLTSQSWAASKEEIHLNLQKLTAYFTSDKELKTVGNFRYWEGQQELHPVWDLLFYIALTRTGHATEEIKKETLKRLFDPKWRDPRGPWKAVPNQNVKVAENRKMDMTASITASIVLTLLRTKMKDENGRLYDKNHPLTRQAWTWLSTNYQFGGNDKDVMQVNILFRIFLAVVKVLPRSAAPLFPANLLGIPKGYPMSPVDLGVFRTVMIPLCVWDFYGNPLISPRILRLKQSHLDSKGADFGTIRDQKLLGELLGHMSDWDNFTTFVVTLADITGRNDWAQEGIGYIISRKQEGNTWYVLGSSLVSIMALQAAHERTVFAPITDPFHLGQPIDGNTNLLKNAIDDSVKGMLAWRKLGGFVPAARSPIWDSSLALQNMYLLPDDLLASKKDIVDDVSNYFIKNKTTQRGDWEFWKDPESQLVPNSYAAWGFYPEAVWHPDTDDSASVMETLLHKLPEDKITSQGLKWILSQQNKDGGFPAWEKDTSKLSNDLMQKLLSGFPRVADFSQPDVSSRIQRMLLNAHKVSSLKSTELETAIKRNCEYLKSHKDPKNTNTPQLWEGDWIVDYTYGTAEVVSSLIQTSKEFPECWSLSSAAPYIEWFVRIQNSDGGWGESIESYEKRNYVNASSSVLQTTYVMKALLTYEKALRASNAANVTSPLAAIQKGVDYLIKNINENGSVKEQSFTGVYIKGAIYSDYTLMPEYHTIGVLGEVLQTF